jgi:hypothetical protein
MDGEEPIRAMRPVLKFREGDHCKPMFQLTDDSLICAYMRNNKMQSSFVSDKYFDGGIDLSSPLIGIGINATYSKTKTTTNEERETHSTCIFNYPRATLKLDLSYLEPTQEFLGAVNNALQHTSAENSELKKVLLNYGHVYPQQVVLGGHLYHSETHHIKGNADESKTLREAEARFKAAFHVGGGSENKLKEERAQQDSSITFQAVGGDTVLSRDPTLWAQTVTNPKFWRIIQQSDYQSVLTLLSKQQQKMISK